MTPAANGTPQKNLTQESRLENGLQTSANAARPNHVNRLKFAEDMTETDPQDRVLGYARVSTYSQTLDAQLEQLKAAGCAKVYREKATGVQVERRELQRMLKAMALGDVVTVTRIDRLARSTFDLFFIVKSIAYADGQFRSLAGRSAQDARAA